MQVTETHSAGLKREYKVVVGQAELNSELNAKLADMSKRANIKGFRPGKVPVAHLKRVYGRSAMAEVLQDAVDTRSKKLLEEKNLKPAYQPEVKLPTDEAEIAAVMDGKGDLSFTMALEVIPDFDVKDHSGLALVRQVVPATPATPAPPVVVDRAGGAVPAAPPAVQTGAWTLGPDGAAADGTQSVLVPGSPAEPVELLPTPAPAAR